MCVALWADQKLEESACLELIYPHPYALIDQKSVKIQAGVTCDPEDVEYLAFYENYSTYADWRLHKGHSKLIKKLIRPPFEAIWDCSHIPDQVYWCAWLRAELKMKNGQIVRKGAPLFLDRNPELSTKTINAIFNSKKIEIDCQFDEWIITDTLFFMNLNKKVMAFINWNREALFFAVQAEDDNIINTYTEKEITKLYHHDGIGLTFDPLYDREPVFNRSHRLLRFAVNSLFNIEQNYIDTSHHLVTNLLKSGIQFMVKNRGSLNKPDDLDTGYVMEISIPWQDLSIKEPVKKQNLGFNLICSNTDNPDKEGFPTSWMGLPIINEINPSEWGTLKLIGSGKSPAMPILVSIIVLLAAVFCLVMFKRRGPGGPETSHFQSLVNQYLEDNYSNFNLSIKDVADHLKLNKDYFGQKFKQEFKQFFPDYLNRFRLEKAKIQLKQTNLPVLDISLMVGFKSPENFARLFKKHFKSTPTEWR